MKRKMTVPLMFILLLTMLACNRNRGAVSESVPTAPQTATPTTTPKPASSGLNLLLVAQGSVKLKRDGWSDYYPTAFGSVLLGHDLLQSAQEVIVLCENLTLWTVPAAEPASINNGCPPTAEPPLKRGQEEIDNTRFATNPFIPYIIAPRMTHLLTFTPRLRWNKVEGASSYTVRIQGAGQTWEEEVSTTEIVYPNQPPFKPGGNYLLTVKTDHGQLSTDEGTAKLGFVVLSAAEAESVRKDSATLEALDLPHEAKALAKAHLYASHHLIAEAIEILENLHQSGTQSAASYRLLADLYRQTGLPLQAESPYQQAITFAQAANDHEAQAAAQAGLGYVYASLNNKDEAIRWLEQAISGYQTLGDTQRVSELEERLANLGILKETQN